MKNLITITSLLAAGTVFANAATTLFNFGSTVDGWTNYSQTSGNSFTKTDDTTGVSFKVSNTNGNITSGNFTATGTTSLSSSITDEFEELFGSATFDNTVFNTGLANGAKGGGSVEISGLSAGNAYTFYYVFGGVKSEIATNTYGVNFSGLQGIDLAISYAVGSGEFQSLTAENKTITSNSGDLVVVKVENAVASSDGKINFTMAGQRDIINAFAITDARSVPEPSMFGLLAGLGALALVGARRRRKTK